MINLKINAYLRKKNYRKHSEIADRKLLTVALENQFAFIKTKIPLKIFFTFLIFLFVTFIAIATTVKRPFIIFSKFFAWRVWSWNVSPVCILRVTSTFTQFISAYGCKWLLTFLYCLCGYKFFHKKMHCMFILFIN